MSISHGPVSGVFPEQLHCNRYRLGSLLGISPSLVYEALAEVSPST